MKLRPLRSSCINSFFIATISSHAFHPPDSLRLSMWRNPRPIAARFRRFSVQSSTQLFQPSDSLRFIKWRAPRPARSAPAPRVLRQPAKPSASWRFIMKLSPS